MSKALQSQRAPRTHRHRALAKEPGGDYYCSAVAKWSLVAKLNSLLLTCEVCQNAYDCQNAFRATAKLAVAQAARVKLQIKATRCCDFAIEKATD
jgi:hypothetical protein